MKKQLVFGMRYALVLLCAAAVTYGPAASAGFGGDTDPPVNVPADTPADTPADAPATAADAGPEKPVDPVVRAKEIAEKEGEDAVAAYLGELAKKRLEKALARKEPGPPPRDSEEYREMIDYGNLLERMAAREILLVPVLKHIDATPVLTTRDADIFSSLEYRVRQSVGKWEILERLPVVQDWPSFRARSFGDDGGSVLWEAVEAVRRDRYRKKALIGKLEAIKPRTFGVGLILLMSDVEPASAALAYLGGYLDQIKASSDGRKRDLFLAVEKFVRHRDYFPNRYLDGKAREFCDLYRTFLTDETLEELDGFPARKVEYSDPRRYARDAGRIVAALLERNDERAEKIFAHAVKTIDDYHLQNAREGYVPQPGIEYVLAGLGNEANSLRSVEFLCRAAQGKDVKAANVYRMAETRFERAFRGIFNCCRSRFEPKGKGPPGRIRFPAKPDVIVKSFKATVEDIQEALGKTHPPCLRGPLRSALHYPSVDTLLELHGWAAARNKDASPFLDELSALLRMMIADQKGARDPKAPRGSVTDYYAGVVSDRSLSPAWRFGVFLAWTMDHEHPETAQAMAVPAAEACLEMDAPAGPNAGDLHELLLALNESEPDERWEKSAGPVCTRWRTLALAGKDRDDERYRSSHDRDVGLAALETHVKLGRADGTAAILARKSLWLSGYVPTYAVLAAYGSGDLALERLQSDWKHVEIESSYPYALPEKARGALAGFVEKVTPEDLRFFARVMFASLPSRNRDPFRRGTYRPDMKLLEPLAEEFRDRKFDDPAIRKKCLEALLREGLYDILKKDLYAVCSGEDLHSLLSASDTAASGRRERFKVYLECLLEDGDLETYRAHCRTVAGIPSTPTAFQIADAKRRFFDVFPSYLTGRERKELWKNTAEEYLETGKDLVTLADEITSSRHKTLFEITLALHFICGKAGEVGPWLQECRKKNDLTSILKQLFYDRDLQSLFGAAAMAAPPEKRAALGESLRALLNSEAVRPFLRERTAKDAEKIVGTFTYRYRPLVDPPPLDPFAQKDRDRERFDARRGYRDERIVELLASSLEDEDAKMRISALRGLGMLAKQSLEIRASKPAAEIPQDPHAKAVLNLLNDAGPDVRRNAGYALVYMHLPNLTKVLVAHLMKESDPAVFRDLARVLVERGNNSETPALIASLTHKDAAVRLRATEILGCVKDSRAMEPLLTSLGDTDPRVRAAAAEALGRMRDLRVVEPLMKLLGDESAPVRKQAITSLGSIGDARARKAVEKAARDKDEAVRAAAVGERPGASEIDTVVFTLADTVREGVEWIVYEKKFVGRREGGDLRNFEGILAAHTLDAMKVNGLSFAEDSVWAATDKGAFRYDRSAGTWKEHPIDGKHSGVPVTWLSIDARGKITFKVTIEGTRKTCVFDTATGNWEEKK